MSKDPLTNKVSNKFANEVSNAQRINELRNIIRFLVEQGMFNNGTLARPLFKKALAIVDEQKELENPQMQLWSRPKETK